MDKFYFDEENSKNNPDVAENVDSSTATLARIAALYDEGHMSDICLVVGGIEYPCHRLILGASSDVLKAMFTANRWDEASKSIVELRETTECQQVFGDFLRYFYTGKMRITFDHVLPTLLLADKYNIRDLVNHCLDFMTKNLVRASLQGLIVQWMQYTVMCNHEQFAQTCWNFVSWNLPLVINELPLMEPSLFCSFLQESDLVVFNEHELFKIAVSWLLAQKNEVAEKSEFDALVLRVMSNIRFPLMNPHQLAHLSLCPLANQYTDLFLQRIALGMAFHNGSTEAHISNSEDSRLLLTPRLYTADANASVLTIENFRHLPLYHTNTLVFTSHTGLKDNSSDQVCEWVIDVHPKGVWIKKFYLISFEGNVEVPEVVLPTVRISITCKDPFPSRPFLRVKIGILVYGCEGGVEYVRSVTQRIHQFNENDRVLHIDDLLPFEALNPPASKILNVDAPHSPYLVGPRNDTLKIHVIIQPLSPAPTPSFSS